MDGAREDRWVDVAAADELAAKGRMVVKVGRRQIALFETADGIRACNNRCPHEGYPLSEGQLSDGCVLTCNWHNWKFDLASGETLVGGDPLRVYPARVDDGRVWLDVADAPADERRAEALASLREAVEDVDYARIAREVVRFEKAEGDALDAVAAAVEWTHDRLEFGMTHAHAAAADWLALRGAFEPGSAERLVPVVECIAHLADDTRREPSYPFAEGTLDYDADALADAIEGEDETTAIRLARGALDAGLGYADLQPALARAALAHYADFGHSLIYVVKAGELAACLGGKADAALLLVLIRALVYASREDLIPEFKAYAPALAAWDGRGQEVPAATDFVGAGVEAALRRCLPSSGRPEALYGELLAALARQMLQFDLSWQDRTDRPVQDNVTWLGFTHALTFSNAVRLTCARWPELWPQGLLQMACFHGRNVRYSDPDLEVATWRVDDPATFLDEARRGLVDHGQGEYIVSAHLIKTVTAVQAEVEAAPQGTAAPLLAAAVNRFLHSPLKRRHSLRTARQSIGFVAAED